MSSAVASSGLPTSRSRRAINPRIVAAVVEVPTFMEVLDTTIAVIALRSIAGSLSATVDDGEWVLSSYLAANAIILPITGWLIAHLGRRNYLLLSIAIFTLASGLCGIATSLGQLILFRVIQGLAGGGLQPSSQGVLLDAFPVERQGMAMTLFGSGRVNRTRRWSHARGLDYRPLFVAVGILDQCADGLAGAERMCTDASRSRVPHRATEGIAPAAVQL